MRFAEKTKQCGNSIINFPKRHPKVWFSLVMAVMMLFGGGVGALLCGHVIPEIQRYLSFNELDTMKLYTQKLDWEAIRENGESPCWEDFCELPQVGLTLGSWKSDTWKVYDADDPSLVNEWSSSSSWFATLRKSVAVVEVEYRHFRALRKIRSDGSIEDGAYVLAECRVLRQIAAREGELGKAQLQSGRDIVVLLGGSTQAEIRPVPVLKPGDRAILMIENKTRAMSTREGARTPTQYYATHTARFYIPVEENESGQWKANCTSLKEHLQEVDKLTDKEQIKKSWEERMGMEMSEEKLKEFFWGACTAYGVDGGRGDYPEETDVAYQCLDMLKQMKLADHMSMSDLGRWFDTWYRKIPLYPYIQPYNYETQDDAWRRVKEVREKYQKENNK